MKIRKIVFLSVIALALTLSTFAAIGATSMESTLMAKPDKPGKPGGDDPDPTPTWDKATLEHKLPWWNDLIDVEQQSYTGAGTVVVVIDTGLGENWVDLFPAENILTDYCRSYTEELGKDRVAWNKDTEGHGTSVTATIIGYRLAYSGGEYWIKGVAEDAKIVMIRGLYWIGGRGKSGVTETEMLNNWADGIDYARSLKAGALSGYNMIVSMSLGFDRTNSRLTQAVSDAEAAGIVVSTSAGNEGPGPDTTAYPANLADCTSVASAGHQDLDYNDGNYYPATAMWTDLPENDYSKVFLSDFSSRGKVDITGFGDTLVLPSTDGSYYYISGTSFSCPQVSGVFALQFEQFGSQTVAWHESYMQNNAVDLGYTFAEQGYGLVQAD